VVYLNKIFKTFWRANLQLLPTAEALARERERERERAREREREREA
jgi:hypothetical protein